MNELELMSQLRDEVPLAASPRIEDVVMAAAAQSHGPRHAGRRRLARGTGASRAGRLLPRPALRPVLAGALAVAVGAGAYAGVELSGSRTAGPVPGSQTAAWSGRPTAPWPSDAHPSYGRASTESQLISYVTRAADSVPGRAPKPDEWVAVKYESAQSSGGGGGYIFGLPDERQITLQWFRGDECGPVAEIPPVPASLAPGKTVTGKLTISQSGNRMGCGDSGLGGWKSVSYSYLDSLPTDPAALEDIIAQNGAINSANRDQAVFEGIDNLLDPGEMQGVVVPPKLTAALYRVLQQLPGVHFETSTDLAGRTGLGFSMVLEGYLKETLVIDPYTYTYMGFKDVAIKDHAMVGTDGTRHVKAGHVMGWGALLGSAIVDKPGQLP